MLIFGMHKSSVRCTNSVTTQTLPEMPHACSLGVTTFCDWGLASFNLCPGYCLRLKSNEQVLCSTCPAPPPLYPPYQSCFIVRFDNRALFSFDTFLFPTSNHPFSSLDISFPPSLAPAVTPPAQANPSSQNEKLLLPSMYPSATALRIFPRATENVLKKKKKLPA